MLPQILGSALSGLVKEKSTVGGVALGGLAEAASFMADKSITISVGSGLLDYLNAFGAGIDYTDNMAFITGFIVWTVAAVAMPDNDRNLKKRRSKITRKM